MASGEGAPVEIDAQDVVRVVLQWARESGLDATAVALAREARVSLNAPAGGRAALLADTRRGRWDAVLPAVATLELPRSTLEALYELVALEMAEAREADTAKALLRQTAVMAEMRQAHPEKHARLERIVTGPYFDAREAYGAGGRESRREAVAALLGKEAADVPPGRLLALLGQALKWQQNIGQVPLAGGRFDLLAGKAAKGEGGGAAAARGERPCVAPARRTRVGSKKSHSECVAVSADGAFLVAGTSDGFIEVLDVATGKMRTDLQFQADDAFMMHDDSVLCVAFSRDSELLASGSLDGVIKVWRVRTGQLLRIFTAAHAGSTNSVMFSRDNSHVLSAGSDGLVRVHGLKSGRMIKEMRGHDGSVVRAVYGADMSRVYSGARDGSIKVWDAKTGDNLLSFKPPSPTAETAAVMPQLVDLAPVPGQDGALLVCTRSPELHVMSTEGEVLRSYKHAKADANGAPVYTACCLSPSGEFVYAASEAQAITCFAKDGREEGVAEDVHGAEVISMCHHPHSNRVYSVGMDGKICLTEE